MVDASAALSALLNAGPARRALAEEHVNAPHLIDAEVANGLRRGVLARRVDAGAARAALEVWRRVGITRHAVVPYLARVWELRESLSSYDASYVALSETLDCALLTADARLGRATGTRCPVTLVPR